MPEREKKFRFEKFLIMELLFVNWNVDPEIFRIGPVAVRWYGLLFAAAFFAGYVILQRIFKNEGLSQELLDKLTMYVFLGTVIGARLGHCLFYEPAYYLSHPLEILKIWQGGLASHGAAIAILMALFLFSRKVKKSFLWTFDRVVIVAALGCAFIRVGNLMNSEIYGYVTDVKWGFVFIRDHQLVPRHPTQIYEALSYLVVFFILFFSYWRIEKAKTEGFLSGVFMVLMFSARFLIEFLKEVQEDFESSMVLNMGQWLSLPFIIAGLAIIFYILRNKKPVVS